MKTKICGQTSLEDARMSVEHGADFLGVVFNVEWSARTLSGEQALPIFQEFGERTFLLTFNQHVGEEFIETVETLKPYAIQLTGQESPEQVARLKKQFSIPVFKSIHLEPETETEDSDTMLTAFILTVDRYTKAGVNGFVLDVRAGGKFGGTGLKSDWVMAEQIVGSSDLPMFLAGGVNPGNVAEALKMPGVYGVDLVSGVEESKGKKSPEKLKAFFDNYNEALADPEK